MERRAGSPARFPLFADFGPDRDPARPIVAHAADYHFGRRGDALTGPLHEMLLDLLKSLVGRKPGRPRPEAIARSIDEVLVVAQDRLVAGQVDEALLQYQRALDLDPYHVVALNQVALCLTKLKRDAEAAVYFERAALIDDSFAPALVNLAIQLNEQYRSAEAERYLEMARKVAPDEAHVDGVLGAVKMLRGRPHEANEIQLSAWLKSFDTKDFAHNFLFNCSYPSGAPAARLTAEHVFWAETRPPADPAVTAVTSKPFLRTPVSGRKIRIGYISGDFRQHSVRYFFRPLLENHDRTSFEVFVYHDMAYEDEQTRLIRDRADHFRSIANQPDAEVARLLREDGLDVLVELAGHTSITRVQLFRERLVPLQLTAIGYPPTTGIREIDFKVVDSHTAPPGAEKYYAERLMRLPTSFWCFNPLEQTPEVQPAPAERNGHVTFGCFGNISKISQRALSLWARIMREVPDSRLVLKAITFQDEEAKESIRRWLAAAEIDLERVSLVPPDKPELLYAAYSVIDIVLDTYPFNGGTTSCYALWMGVPIVTLQGEQLVSRMGASMLQTLGLPELIAEDDEGYVSAAVSLACDLPRLAKIRSEMRPRMLATPLGNGALYAREFERACLDALRERDAGLPTPAARLPTPVLDEAELVRRAEFVQRTGQLSAALRIADYCLAHYPASISACIVKSSLLEGTGRLDDARRLLADAIATHQAPDVQRGLEVNLSRLELMLGLHDSVLERCSRLDREPLDGIGRLHVDLYSAAAQAWRDLPAATEPGARSAGGLDERSLWVVHCDDDGEFGGFVESIASALGSLPRTLRRVRGEGRMAQCLRAVADADVDHVVFLRKSARILSPDFLQELEQALQRFDIVAAAGSERVGGTLWFDAGYPAVHGAIVLPNGGPVGGLNLSVYGPTRRRFHPDLAVLDASLFAVRRAALSVVEFDLELDGEHSLCEFDWFVRARAAGLQLGAAPRLCIANLDFRRRAGANWHDCARRFVEKHGLSEPTNDDPVAGAAVLLPSPRHALAVVGRFTAESAA